MGYGFSLQSLGIPLDDTGAPDIQEVPSAPSSGVTGTLYIDTSDPIHSYYFVGSHRYKLTAVLDDATRTAFNFIDATGFNFVDATEFDFAT